MSTNEDGPIVNAIAALIFLAIIGAILEWLGKVSEKVMAALGQVGSQVAVILPWVLAIGIGGLVVGLLFKLWLRQEARRAEKEEKEKIERERIEEKERLEKEAKERRRRREERWENRKEKPKEEPEPVAPKPPPEPEPPPPEPEPQEVGTPKEKVELGNRAIEKAKGYLKETRQISREALFSKSPANKFDEAIQWIEVARNILKEPIQELALEPYESIGYGLYQTLDKLRRELTSLNDECHIKKDLFPRFKKEFIEHKNDEVDYYEDWFRHARNQVSSSDNKALRQIAFDLYCVEQMEKGEEW